jgi:hypothetical protein
VEGDGSVQLSAVCSVLWCVVVCGGARGSESMCVVCGVWCEAFNKIINSSFLISLQLVATVRKI